ESPVVQRLIRGIKRFHGEQDRKPVQPITRPFSLPSLHSSDLASPPATPPSTLRTASPTPVSFDPGRLLSAPAEKTPVSTLRATACSFSPTSKTARTLPSPSLAPKTTPFAKASPSPSPPLPARLHVPSPLSNASSRNSLEPAARRSSKVWTASPSITKPLSLGSAAPSRPLELTPRDSPVTAFVAAPLPRPPLPASATTKSSFSAAGAATRTSCTSKTPSPESSTYPDNSTWLIPTPSLSSLR
ncbi:hypothetical protein B0H19DRAFT_981955, partial [Mycena capillaripes]